MPTWLDDLSCTGTEASLNDCAGNAWGDENCGHSEDIGIVCAGPEPGSAGVDTEDNWTNGNIRLVPDQDGIQGAYSGRLEVFYEDEWGTVCDDMFDSDNNGAQVACKQLGLPW